MLMLLNLPHILAADDGGAKLLGLIIFGAIWAIGALANWVAKQQKAQKEAQQREQVRRSIEAQRGSATPAARQRAPQAARANQPRITQTRRPVQAPPRLAPPPVPTRRDIAARGRRAAPPPLAAQRRAPAAAAPAPVQEVQPTVVTRGKPPSAAGATAISAWLKPATLRQQFILTELLQPPLALRDEHL
jgi:hypothetical protein